MAHKSNDEDMQNIEVNKSQYICRKCQQILNSNNELNRHIINEHRSYKPCRNFATNSCEYEECRFNHDILTQGQSICYKCGDKFAKKSVLLNHLKNDHNEPCLRFQEGRCTYGNRCVYKHTSTDVTNVKRTQLENRSEGPHIESHSDFPYIPTTEKRLVGTQMSTEQLMLNMNNMITKMSQMMTRMEEILSLKQQ